MRDLDVTAAFGLEAACPRKRQRGWRLQDSGQASLSPSSITPRRGPSSPPVNAIRASCPAFVQVSIQTRTGLPGSCAHHYDTNFAALVLAGCDRTKHIGDLKPPVDRNPS